MYRLIWNSCCHQQIALFEDPITGGLLAYESFIETYGPLLETLDGRDMSSYVDFYFETSACNNTVLVFVDEDAKLDFRDEAILMNLIPPIVDVMAGEDGKAAEERKEKARQKEEQKRKQQKIPTSAVERKRKQLFSAQVSLDRLSKQLEATADLKKRQQLEKKVTRITALLAGSSLSL